MRAKGSRSLKGPHLYKSIFRAKCHGSGRNFSERNRARRSGWERRAWIGAAMSLCRAARKTTAFSWVRQQVGKGKHQVQAVRRGLVDVAGIDKSDLFIDPERRGVILLDADL